METPVCLLKIATEIREAPLTDLEVSRFGLSTPYL